MPEALIKMTKSIRYSKFKNCAIFSHTDQIIEGRDVKDSIPGKFEVLKSGKILRINYKSIISGVTKTGCSGCTASTPTKTGCSASSHCYSL
jgi:hypothetical protein